MISWLEKRKYVSLTIALLIAGFIFYMSSLSFSQGTAVAFPLKSILYHFGIFFILAFFLHCAFVQGRYYPWILPSILLAIIYGITDELHQAFVPSRFPSISDVATNTLGILTASILYLLVRIKQRKLL